ncbi:MAG: zinc metallopeptidase [Clostridiales Family XIII bacterium]|jgi:Zn-dependent membrane protease YugP|nr:zinc metallopeptidase [Clostridiales Family XIII bacterium]
MIYYDYTILLLLPAVAFSMAAQFMVTSAYGRYAATRNRRGVSGAQAARTVLDRNGLRDVGVVMVRGRLSDHYDPRKRVVALSEEVYRGSTVAAVSIAAHEAGHAIQHGEGYMPLAIRSGIAPVASVASKCSWVLILLGMFLVNSRYAGFGPLLFDLGIALYVAVVLFQGVTLPVEYNASKRARLQIDALGLVPPEDMPGVRKVLSAAALTYVAAMASAVLTLARLLLIRERER